MDKATVAILISCLSAGFALGGLLWQLILYKLNGPRVVVRMRPVVLGSDKSVLTGPETGWRKPIGSFSAVPFPVRHVDLAEVEVANIGRSPIWLSDLGLDVGATGLRRRRRTVRGHPVKLLNSCQEDRFELQPGAIATAYFDVWAIVGKVAQADLSLGAIMRGTVKPAGRRSRRSKWRKRWRIFVEDGALYPGVSLTPELLSWRAFWRYTRLDDELDLYAPMKWVSLRRAHKAGESLEVAIQRELSIDSTNSGVYRLAAEKAYEALSGNYTENGGV